MVVSPGVPHDNPVIARARAAGMPVIGDIELFAQARAGLPPHKVVGITGTNGKSTTAALIHHILVTAGIPAGSAATSARRSSGRSRCPRAGCTSSNCRASSSS